MTDSSQQARGGALPNSSLVLPVILMLATGLRLHYIGHHSFWVDELFTLKLSSYGVADLVREVGSFDNHPPTYYLLLHFWIQAFGNSEVSLRVPSAIFSILSVYFTFKAGRLLFDKQVASIAALLLAVSGFSIYYAQEARMYSLLALCSVMSVYFLLKFLEQQTWRRLFNYIWASTFLVYTHLYGIFVVLAENIYVLALLYRVGNSIPRVFLRRWIGVQGIIVLLSLPWFGLLINRILNIAQEGFWVEVPTAGSFMRTFAAFSGTHGGLALWILLMLIGGLSGLTEKTGFTSKIFGERSNDDAGWQVSLLLMLIFTPILLPYLISQFTTPIYIIRSTIAGHFAFVLLVAKGIADLGWRNLRVLALILVLAASLKPLLREGYTHHAATDFRRAVDYLASNVGSEDKIVICSDSHLTWPFEYYAKARGLSAETVNFGSTERVSDLLNKQKGWYVFLIDRESQCEPELQALSDQYTRLEIENVSAENIGIAAFIDKR